MIGDKILETQVRDIERATSPLNTYVKILDVDPPGHNPKTRSPKARVFESGRPDKAINVAKIGRNKFCNMSPIRNAFGLSNTFLKLEKSRESPIPNIIRHTENGKKIWIRSELFKVPLLFIFLFNLTLR